MLRAHRRAAGITQEQLAERAELSVATLRNLEAGRREPRFDTLQRLVTALALSPEERAALFAALGRPRRAPVLSPLAGREQEMERLSRHLAGEGRPLLLLTGEPGIGKTRLLQEAARQGVATGYTVLTAGFDRVGEEPYAALRQMLRTFFQAQDPSLLATQLEGCAWLVSLLPELAGGPLASLPTHALPLDQQRAYLAAALARFLRNVAGPAGTLLLLDDLHWVDADTFGLSTALLAVPDLPVRLVAAYRDTALRPGHPLDDILTALAHQGQTQQLKLGPLSAGEARALLGALLGEEGMEAGQRERVLARASGVPLYLVSYALSYAQGRRGEEEVPWDVARGVRQRVTALPAETQEVLQAAAVMGEIRRARLAAVFSPELADAALDDACRAGLLIEVGAGRYRFAHDLMRETIEADLGASRRAALHRRLAHALERAEASALPVEELAYHYGHCDDALAARYLELSGDRAQAQGATQRAEQAYQEAITRLGQAPEAARVRVKLGRALRLAGRGHDRALQVLGEAAAVFREARQWEELGKAAAEIAYTYAAGRNSGEGIERLSEVRLLLETEVALGGPGSGLAALEAAMAQLYTTAGLLREHVGALERAAALARSADDPEMLAAAELNRGIALVSLGRIPEGVAVLEEGARLAEEAGNLHALITALPTAASLLCGMLELEPALAHLQRAREVAERLGDLVTLAFIHFSQGVALRFQGRWEEARVTYEQGRRIAEQVEGSWAAWAPSLGLAVLSLDQGELEICARLLEESRRQAQWSGYPFAVPWVEIVLAQRALQAGRREEANTRLELLRDLPAFPFLTHLIRLIQGCMAVDAGDLETATGLAAQLRASAVATLGRANEVDALWLQARIAMCRRYWGEARQLLDEGLALMRRWPYAPGELRLLEAYADLERSLGNVEATRERLEDLLTRFQRLGAGRKAERIVADLARLSQDEIRGRFLETSRDS